MSVSYGTLDFNAEMIVVPKADGSGVSVRGRPIFVQALLGSRTPPTGPIPHPLGLTDMKTNDQYPMDSMDKGHLIARRFLGAGADVAVNIVPLHPTFNRQGGLWSSLENALAKQPGNTVQLTIQIHYLSKMVVVPDRLVVTAAIASGGHVVFKGRALDGLPFPHVATLPIQLTEAGMIVTYGLTDKLGSAVIADVKKALTSAPEDYDFVKLHDSKRTLVGGAPKDRLYSFLDRLYIDGESEAVKAYVRSQIVPGGGFDKEQRVLIKIANRLRNDGWLKSDDPSDPLAGQALAEGSGPTCVNIDHAWPMAKSGWNCFSNARLTSEKANKSKTDTIMII